MALPLITAAEGLSGRNALFPILWGRRRALPARVIRGGWLVSSVMLMASLSPAQEALRNSLAGDAAAEARADRMESLPYTFKAHDLRVLLTPALGINWNDNINISRTDPQQDFILKPSLRVGASYPLTERNLLNLQVGVGYQQYIEHDEHSTWFLESGTELSFDVFIKDFWINFHDRVDYIRDTAERAELAGTTDFATINNAAGLNVTWDLNRAILSAGYDHLNVISTSQEFNSQDRESELFFARAGFRLNPALQAGVEGTASFSTYGQAVLNDNRTYGAGVYADWRPGRVFRISPRVGYTISEFSDTSQTGIQTSGQESWYARLSISHEVTDAISYSLNAGHESRAGIQADVVEVSYARANVRWDIIKDLSLSTFFSYEHGEQGTGNVAGNLTEEYDWIGTGLSARYEIMKQLSLAVNYRLTLRSSSAASREYTQNVVGLLLTYYTR